MTKFLCFFCAVCALGDGSIVTGALLIYILAFKEFKE